MNLFMLPDFNKIMEDAHRPFVQKGAAWLDEYEPKWVNKIVPETLDLACAELCICGQIFGDYGARPEAVLKAWEYGFTTPECYQMFAEDDGTAYHAYHQMIHGLREYYDVGDPGWMVLDRLWLDEIWWRLSPLGVL